ncbi:putative minor capsid protein [Lactiplantibacillus plantarum]|uniref:putative minor capsid protein n=1 Tax=Lactiplantibacillus plantarum TaxID=1590 RepID=UPI000978ABB7|nr:putative minor capsid protein [Lactiplantibacillus plantarum]
MQPIPLELLDDSIKVTVFDKQTAKTGSWGKNSNDNSTATYTINHVRVEPATAVSVQSVGGDASVQSLTGSYTLFVDNVNSTPLDVLPKIDDRVKVQSTQQTLIVKSFDPIYDFGTHIHHWEGVLQ